MMKKIRLTILLPFAFSAQAALTCQVVFVRHAETKYNLTGSGSYYNKGMTSQRWLIETGYQDEKDKEPDARPGVDQIYDLTEALAQIDFDKIIVSPVRRTRLSLLDYLFERGLGASVWPEFQECCYGSARGSLRRGGSVEDFTDSYLPYINEVRSVSSTSEARSPFVYDNEMDRLSYTNIEGSEGNRLVDLAADRVVRACAPGKKILIVGHSLHGARFIKKLTGKSVRVYNTGAYLMTRKSNGSFDLKAPRTPSLQGNLEVLSGLSF